jgi:putative transposase
LKGEAPSVKVEISVAEVAEVFKELRGQPGKIVEMVKADMPKAVGEYLSEIMKVELAQFLGRQPYERADGESNHRNGSYPRRFALKGIGEVGVRVPRDRRGEYETQVIPRSKQYEDELRQDIAGMFLGGLSTRTLAMMSQRLLGHQISAGEVSRCSRELIKAIAHWRNRDLSTIHFKYLFCDGVYFEMRVADGVDKVPVLVVIGVTENGQKQVIGLQAGDKESAANWREMFKDLKRRGLDGLRVLLGIMDGLAGLEKVFAEEFPKSKVQRCQVHVARNVLAKVPQKLKEKVADDIRSIFYASSKEKALDFATQFAECWQKDVPSAVKCLQNSLASCLTFFDFPREEWISLRTTNVIERLNKEFKRRTRPMEIVAGENACYTLLAFISIKMEIYWRSNPVATVLSRPLSRLNRDGCCRAPQGVCSYHRIENGEHLVHASHYGDLLQLSPSHQSPVQVSDHWVVTDSRDSRHVAGLSYRGPPSLDHSLASEFAAVSV